MSKRQALGAITVNSNAASSVFNQRKGGAAASGPSKKPGQFNNENQPPAGSKSKSNDLEFEIFHEERVTASIQVPARNPLGLLPHSRPTNESTKQVNFYLDSQEREDDDDDEQLEDKPGSQEYSNDKENDEDEAAAEEEEEGISRLNLAAMMDSASSSIKHELNEDLNASHCELMMDSSSSTHNDSGSSPMLLDDTIKCASNKSAASSLFIDFDDDEDTSVLPDNDYDDEEDEETRRRLASIDRDNIMMNFAEYKDEILVYMRRLEQENRPKSTYMKKQMDITSNMRSILVDWLVEVCEEYKLNPETLYLAVNYTDRFLSQMSVLRGKLQLVGTASMYIASKYEEIVPPDISEFVYITDDTYTKKQVLRMEHLLLKVLEFKMSPPTANWFLSYFLRFIRQNTSLSHSNELGQRIENLARYLAELTLIDSDTYLVYLPSQIAASAIYLAMYTLGRPWSKQVGDICGYSLDLGELKSCIQDLLRSMQAAPSHPQQAIQEKYKQKKYDYAALIEAPKNLPPHLSS